MTSSPFRYPGGKTKKSVQKLILGYMPDGTKEYREPFCGGAGIFFGINNHIRNKWINDINPGLMSVYFALRDRPQEFISLCRSIEPMKKGEEEVSTRGTGKKYNKRLGDVFNSLKYNEACDQALRYLFINRTNWAGRVNYDPAFESRMYYSNPQGWNIVSTNRLEKAANHLRGTKITVGDYSELFTIPGNSCWIYADPPYVVDTEFNNGSKLYEFGFTPSDHMRFVETVKKCKHKVCISYDNRSDVKSWFKPDDGFFIHEHEWVYCGSSKKTKDIGKELIITNYPVFIPAKEEFVNIFDE